MKVTAKILSLVAAMAYVATIVVTGQGTACAQTSPSMFPPADTKPVESHMSNGPAPSLEQQQAYALSETQGNIAFAAGEKSMAAGHTLEAIRFYQQSIAANSWPTHNGDVYMHLGDAYWSLGRSQEAVASYDKLMRRSHPQDPLAFVVSGTFRAAALLKYSFLLQRTGRYAEALGAYREAMSDAFITDGVSGVTVNEAHIVIDEDNIDTSKFDLAFNLGMGAALMSNDSAKAIPYLREALRINPHLAFAHLYLGEAMQTDVSSPELTEAKKHTSYQAEYQKAAAMGSGKVRTSAKARL